MAVTLAGLVQEALKDNGDSLEWIVVKTQSGVVESADLGLPALHKRFDNDFGGDAVLPFTAWGERFIYFPAGYDGATWIGSVRRWPGPFPNKPQ